MATTENDIRVGVILLLKQYGSLTTNEVKDLLETVMKFDEDDLLPSPSRSNETLIKQRIGNIVSHQNSDVKIYENSYQIDKTKQPAVWTSLTGLRSNDTLRALNTREINEKKNLRSRFIPEKVDWNNLNERKSELGLLGEEFVMRYETNQVVQFGMRDDYRVIHLSEEQGDGAGFDILSVDENGRDKYIEVKTTTGNLDLPFYMSKNEKKFFELHRNENDVYLYRVYNFDIKTKKGNIKIITCRDILDNYRFDPVTYKVTKR
ncbi:DUF3883 domain-containing protein [Lactobacillus taiwanensis]|uniref:DUF3883 domain-containing protein n=1 Tax=Lactobacillus taiwanensis TaxID=508451 RepID=UPI00214B9AF9|nr:DUF3883 domain-containing protein [Lactobacillus taiwanensis]MCR1917175.1 DUF3883 domain-containing protein [Lactobacillus taiwanensis]